MVGGSLMMAGTALSYFATSIWVLYFTYGGNINIGSLGQISGPDFLVRISGPDF